MSIKIDTILLDSLTEQAKASLRLRTNYDLRNSSADTSQRMLNAIEPKSEIPIHRHQKTSETVVVLRGRIIEEFYDELPADWKIINENGLTHLLTFNHHKTFPSLSEGWSLFADFYHPPGNVEIIFSYHGSGFFGVKSIMRITGCYES